MKFSYSPRLGRMVGIKKRLLSKPEIERLGGVVPEDGRYVSPGTAYVPDGDVYGVSLVCRGHNIEMTKLNGYSRELGGHLYRFERVVTM